MDIEILVGKPERRNHMGGLGVGWKTDYEGVNWIPLV
jgi:hypothetical protein